MSDKDLPRWRPKPSRKSRLARAALVGGVVAGTVAAAVTGAQLDIGGR